MNHFSRFAIAGASLALGLAAIDINPAQAATMTYDFTVDINSGSLSGQTYDGFFSFDDSTPTRPDGLLPVTDIEFDFLGTLYTEADDPNAGVQLLNGNFLGLQFATNAAFTFTAAQPGFPPGVPPTLDDTSFTYDVSSQPPSGTGNITYTLRPDTPTPTTTPEPNSLVGLLGLGALTVGSLIKSKRK